MDSALNARNDMIKPYNRSFHRTVPALRAVPQPVKSDVIDQFYL